MLTHKPAQKSLNSFALLDLTLLTHKPARPDISGAIAGLNIRWMLILLDLASLARLLCGVEKVHKAQAESRQEIFHGI
ncbi:hypothetical protein CNR22_06475 [Sphingobacteriaceae bacterium]|nr:hypothetical protein CNR22_06475 [Sphingobacteriaceae bacterium]